MRLILAAAAGVLALTSSVAASDRSLPFTPPPVEAYASLPALDQVVLSPDGARLAFIGVTPQGQRRLGVRSLAGEALGAVDLGDKKVRDVFWADNDHVVITTSDYTDVAWVSDRAEFFTAQSFDVRTRRFVTLMRSSSSRGGSTAGLRQSQGTGLFNFIAGPPFQREVDGRIRTFVRSYARDRGLSVFEVDLDSGEGVLRSDFEGVVGPDGKSIARAQWSRDTGRWWLQAKADVGWREIWSGEGFTIDTPSLLGEGMNEGTVLISVPKDGDVELYEAPLAGGDARRVRIDDMVDPAPIYHPLTRKLLGFGAEGEERAEFLFTDDEMARRWRYLEGLFPGQNIRIESATPDYERLVVLTDGASDPGSYALVDIKQQRLIKVGSRYPGVPGETVGPVRFITYAARDGLGIPAYLTLPRGREARGLPLVVMPHGGPQARDLPGFDYWAQVLASRGYAVLQPQYRGSTGFGLAHIEAGYGEWGRKMQTDLTDGVAHLAREGVIDPGKVCIFGWSYGGYAAMAGVTLDPETYRCAVAGAGVSDLPRMLAWERDQTGGRDTDVMRYWKRFMGASRINDNSIAEVSPARLADRVRAPVLLIHGTDDSVVPYEQSEFFRRALEREGKSVDIVELHGEDHWLSRRSGREAVFKAAIAFLERHNPAD